MVVFCQLGMDTVNREGEPVAAKKRTMVLTNSTNPAEVLRLAQCDKSHLHETLVGGKARA